MLARHAAAIGRLCRTPLPPAVEPAATAATPRGPALCKSLGTRCMVRLELPELGGAAANPAKLAAEQKRLTKKKRTPSHRIAAMLL